MTISTMKNKSLNNILSFASILLFWISVWWIFAVTVKHISPQNAYLLPTPYATIIALIGLLSTATFYKAILLSLLRVLLGLILGITVGSLLAFVAHKVDFIRSLLSPVISVIKAMPVATFILILLFTLRGSFLTVFIGFIMVMPIIYQNVLSGLDSIDKNLIEVTKIFELTFAERFKALIFPSVKTYLFPAIITSVGLAFKSQIAAEIIAYTNHSIGQYVYDAIYNLNVDVAFAWATVIVAFSIGLEKLCKYVLRRCEHGA